MVNRPFVDERLCFILMPFGGLFDGYYEGIIKPSVQDAGLVVQRGDEVYGTRAIIRDIWDAIWRAKVIIADVTDRNPNVNYELGLAHAIGVPTVIITKRMDDVPFDYRHRRCICYNTDEAGWEKKLHNSLVNTLLTVVKTGATEDELAWPSKLVGQTGDPGSQLAEEHMQALRPDFTAFVANQWRFFDRMSRYRHQKHAICQAIVERHVRDGDAVLLDSGSTVDQVTSEIVAQQRKGVIVHSNNVLAALHLAGTSLVSFNLLPGEFFRHSWAVYSDEANERLETLGAQVVVLAVAAIRHTSGIMVREGETGNLKFKTRALEAFQRHVTAQLIIAGDASKFCLATRGHQPIVPGRTWNEILKESSNRITIVTSPIPDDIAATERSLIQRQLDSFRSAGVTIDVAQIQ
jgi:hypothetical protein